MQKLHFTSIFLLLRSKLSRKRKSPVVFAQIGEEFFSIDSRAELGIQRMVSNQLGMYRGGRVREEVPTLVERVEEGVAIISIDSVMTRHESFWYGNSYVTLRRDLEALAADDLVHAVMLLIDSPGGHVIGCTEACEAVSDFARVKRIDACTEGHMLSAVFRLACHCTNIWASASAEIGSIGSKISLTDASKAWANEGYEKVDIATGPYKAMGSYGAPVTPEQREFLKTHVEKLQEGFTTSLAARKLSGAQIVAVADGKFWVADDAQRLGLIDGVKNASAVLSELKGDGMSDLVNQNPQGASQTGAPAPE